MARYSIGRCGRCRVDRVPDASRRALRRIEVVSIEKRETEHAVPVPRVRPPERA